MSSEEIVDAVRTLHPMLVHCGFPICDMKLEQLGRALFESNHDKLNLLKYGLSKLDRNTENILVGDVNLERGITQILQDLNFLSPGCEDKFITGQCSIKDQVTVWKKLVDALNLQSSADNSLSEMDVNCIFKKAMRMVMDENSNREIEELIKTIQSELNDDDEEENDVNNLDDMLPVNSDREIERTTVHSELDYDDVDSLNDMLSVNDTISTDAGQPEDCNDRFLYIDEAINNFSSKLKSEIHVSQDLKKTNFENREEFCSTVRNFRESLSSLEKLLEDLSNCMK